MTTSVSSTTGQVKTIKPGRAERGASIRGLNVGGFNQSISVYNFTDEVVYIKTQGNVPVAISPLHGKIGGSIPQKHIEIRVTSSINNSADFGQTVELVNDIIRDGITTSHETKGFIEKIRGLVDREPVLSRHNTVEDMNIFIIRESELLAETCCFIRECNLMLSHSRAMVMEHHPYSNEAWSTPDIRSHKESRQASGNFIRVVDNDNLRDKWYYYSAKKVVEVEAVQDRSKDSGVYFSELVHKDGVNYVTTRYLNFQEASEELGLYTTREDAVTNGNPELLVTVEDARHKSEIEKMKLKLESMRQQAEQLKIEADQYRLKYEMELSRVKHEATLQREEIDVKSLKRKDNFEEKATVRKDNFEKRSSKRKEKQEEASFVFKAAEAVVKSAPLILTGVAAIGIGIALGRGQRDQKSGFIDEGHLEFNPGNYAWDTMAQTDFSHHHRHTEIDDDGEFVTVSSYNCG